ncbi:unnamed protein product [Cylicocyclus nassatus]|uniref:Uncharacterized protein n=1 Tax=Cylicocyclus nassatus TaxID=53992 RepID=A0AA36M8Y7_CYLNA|nr:unnamed protein product [Cylicocyclus nassatus]
MTEEELSIISQFYVENYNVFHAAFAGSSRQPAVKAKRDKLEELARILTSAGYPKRTVTQLANARYFEKSQKGDCTGGEKPRLKGLPCAIEVSGDHALAQPSSSKRPAQTDDEINQPAPLLNKVNRSPILYLLRAILKLVSQPSSSKPPPPWDNESQLSLTDTENEVYPANKNTLEKTERNGGKRVKTEPIFEHPNFDDYEHYEPVPVELHNDAEKENRPREKKKSGRASEIESERIQLRIRNEQLTGDLLYLQTENAKLQNENLCLKNVKQKLEISNEQKRGDYLDQGVIIST